MKPLHPDKLRPQHTLVSHSWETNPERTIHNTLPNVPVNSKLPIPSFYENADGQWILSDNWDLFGLSASTQRHRARSLEEPSLLQAYHATSLPMLQYELTSPNNSSNSNSQKLYLPTGWNHTSKRGPLYATSVIVVASLLIAIAVLSTVVGLVVRRRARRRRRNRLKNSPAESLQPPDHHLSSKNSSLRDIEQVIPKNPTRPDRLNQLNRKLKQLTIIKINYLTKGRKQAKITRIPIVTQPDGPPPPAVILVDQDRRSTSFSSQCRFRHTGSRRRSHPRPPVGPQSPLEHPPHEFLTNYQPHGLILSSPSRLEIQIPSSLAPSIHSSTHVMDSETFQSPTTSDCDAPQADLTEQQSFSSLNAVPNSNFPLQSNQSAPIRPCVLANRTTSEHSTRPRQTDMLPANTRYRRDSSRTSVDPNYRSCHEMIRARSSTISGPQIAHLPLASSSSASIPSSSSALNRNTHEINLHLSSRPGRSGGSEMVLEAQDTFGSIGFDHQRQSDSSPPAYSSQNAPAEGSRAAEKRRMVVSTEAEEENFPTESQQQEDESHDSNYYGVPLVAHVATDDKSVLNTLLKMGSAPTLEGTGSIVEDEGRTGNEEGSIRDADDRLDRMEGSGWRRRGQSYEERQTGRIPLVPSAPPLLYEVDKREGKVEFGSDRRLSRITKDAMTLNSKEIKNGSQLNLGLFKELNDDQIGQNFRDLNILPLPSDQFIIRFDPDSFGESTSSNLLDPSSMNRFEESHEHTTEDLCNYYSPFLAEEKQDETASLPSAPLMNNPITLGNNLDHLEKIYHPSSSNNFASIVNNYNNTTDHNVIIAPSAPPLIVDEDLTSLHHFVPPYAQ